MSVNSRKIGIGIQDFKKLREGGYIFVDKTEYLYNLVQLSTPFFLSRPRRFGKSLFLSMLKYYWEGEKGLFKGLSIEKLKEENKETWESHPVFYFDFNRENFNDEGALESVLNVHLVDWEKEYGKNEAERTLSERFAGLIERAYEKTNKRCVILVDEYDKPLLEIIDNEDRVERNRQVFKGFFSIVKSYDRYIQFVFITGVTKFNKISIFSDLNNLRDISMSYEYSGICGITENEIKRYLSVEVGECAGALGISEEECYGVLKKTYDGYRFNVKGEGIYNPFSLLSAIAEREIKYYWFETGTPTFLVKQLKKTGFDPSRITDQKLFATEQQIKDYRIENPDPLPLLYQSGYLTLKEYDEEFKGYLLGYPNEEVKNGFIASLAPVYLSKDDNETPVGLESFLIDMRNEDTDSLKNRFIQLFASLPYGSGDYVERDFQNVIYILFMLMGQRVFTELHTSNGRADVVVEMKNTIYLFEFKRDKTAKEALKQIEEKGYADRYAADSRHIIKIGANFDSEKKALTEWEVG